MVATVHHLVILGASWVALEAVSISMDMLVMFMLVVHEWGVMDSRWLWPLCQAVHLRCCWLGWLPTRSTATSGGSGI